jgi:hypothetical protein
MRASCVAGNLACRRAGEPACTVENHGPHAQLVGQDGILRPDAIRPLRVFIPLGGTKCHSGSQDWLPRNALRASCRLSARGRSPFRPAWRALGQNRRGAQRFSGLVIQQRCGPTQFPRPPNLPGRLQEFGVSTRQARVPAPHRPPHDNVKLFLRGYHDFPA